MESGIPHDSPAGDFFFRQFELRFDQHDHISVFFQQSKNGREDGSQRNKTDIRDRQRKSFWEIGRLEVAGVDALGGDDAGVLADFPVELAVADIVGVDAGGTVLQEAVGEAPRGGSDVDAGAPGGIDAEGRQGGFQFQPATADEFFLGFHGDGGFGRYFCPGFRRGFPVHQNLARQNQALGFFSRFSQASFDEKLVEPDFFVVVMSGHFVDTSGNSRFLP